MKELTQLVKDFARCQGASAVGIATTKTLSGGPPSTDLAPWHRAKSFTS